MTLPTCSTESQVQNIELQHQRTDPTNQYRILLVDDDEDLLFLGKTYIEKFKDFTVDVALSARQGFEKLQICPYDAIISDYDMPEMNGIVFLEKIRSCGYLAPFIILSGKTREEIAEAHPIPEDVPFLQKGIEPSGIYARLVDSIRNF
ncbi:MAG: response regulator [Methanospirillum sp.]|uniref:response regulator n=1 Tax=Methanospirillum sp. TaxID=45200 RepID=UPI0023706D22|nr:response regulator [Methanospirillum sp.]MDD1729763.1 response regulator [Methanospirillum sp.]